MIVGFVSFIILLLILAGTLLLRLFEQKITLTLRVLPHYIIILHTPHTITIETATTILFELTNICM